MDEYTNPYESPRTTGSTEASDSSNELSPRHRQLREFFWWGVALAALVITFDLAAATLLCLVVAGMLGAGVFVPHRGYRIAGVFGCLLFLGLAWSARQHDIESNQWRELKLDQDHGVEG